MRIIRRFIHGTFFLNCTGSCSLWLVYLLTFLVCLFANLNDDKLKIKKEGNTTLWKWPVSLDYYATNKGKIYFLIEEAISTLGLKQEISHRGYTRIDNFLKEQGVVHSFVCDGLKRKMIGYEAFLSLVMGFCGHKTKLDQPTKELILQIRQCTLGRIHVTEQRKLLRTVSPQKKDCISTALQTTPTKSSTNSTQTSLCSSQGSSQTNKRKSQSTSFLINKENLSQLQQKNNGNGGRLFKSRPLAQRCKAQEALNVESAESIHHGCKDDFILGFGKAASNDKTPSLLRWDGKLSVEDVIDIAKNAHCPKTKKTAYDMMTCDHSVIRYHLDKNYILNVQDNMNSTEFASDLRRKIPGLLDSGYSVDQLKKLQKKECTIVLQPQRTATGWRINPDRLHQCLKYVYPWIPAQEYWRVYGDARTYGKQKSVLLAIGNLNNEQLLNHVQIQSPKELWPLSIFYFADSRLNLELNLSSEESVGYSSGWLNQWITRMKDDDHKVYLTGDSMFLDAVADRKLDPKSETGISIYNYESTATKGEVCTCTGLRSGLKRSITRKLPDSLLPALSTSDYLLCCDHMFTRITETLLTLRVKSIFSLEAESVISKKDRDCALKHLESNINLRGVGSGHFKFYFENGKNKLAPVSLNKTCAQLISAPPDYFQNSSYPNVIDNVAPKINCPGELCSSLQEAISWPSKRITEYDCELLIWANHFRMHEICRLDPAPKLKQDRPTDSVDVNDYTFGVVEELIDEYVKCADIFHGLMKYRYGKDRMTPYMIKAIDIVPILLRSLPFHSIMRVSTEGGEHLHYQHQQHFFHHTPRGGGHTFHDPILAIFEHMYRQIKRLVDQRSEAIQQQFNQFVYNCKASDHTEPECVTPATTTLIGTVPDTTTPIEEQASLTEAAGVISESDMSSDDLRIQTVATTPQHSNKLGCLIGCRFVIAGSLQSYKLNQEKLIESIKHNGGQVLKVDNIPDGLPVKIILITTQKECDKEKINASVIVSYQRKWKIVSPNFITDAIKHNSLPSIEAYELKLDNIKNAPQTSSIHVVARNVDETHFKRIGAFSDLKKTLKANAKGEKRVPSVTDLPVAKKSHKKIKKEPLKKPLNSFMMFVRDNSGTVQQQLQLVTENPTFDQINKELIKQWQGVSPEVKNAYKTKGVLAWSGL